MAATGLLGINPYQKGINLDITSKPANLAIQLAQKEQAKQEALDKYLMDYEKTLNPNGMRQQDQNAFLSKLGEAKQYYLQNRDKILNPAKYGAEYQSNYYAGLRDAQNSIGQSKQAMAQDKLATQHYIAQKDLNAPDGYAEAVELSHLPISDPRYRPLDVTQWKFYKSHDPMEYANKVYSKIPLSESAPEILDVKGRPGYIYSKTISKIAPENYGRVLQDGYNSFETDEGLRKTMINMFADKEKVKELELKYNTKIPTPKALAGVYTLDLQPIKENTTNAVESGASREARARRNMDYNKNQFAPVRNLLDDGTDTVYIWFKKNGSNVARSNTAIDVTKNAGGGGKTVAAWNYVDNYNAGDYVEIVWQSADIAMQLTAAVATGNLPAIPSVIATLTQVS
jgi:hypothetical protein